jgi:predicted transglutaminase-like cysteine proteinase
MAKPLEKLRQVAIAQTQGAEAEAEAATPASAKPASTRASKIRAKHIPIGKTPFDPHWQRAQARPSRAVLNRHLASAGVRSDTSLEDALVRINHYVNDLISYSFDPSLYARKDHWATASETLNRGSGDCEDYVILKLHLLKAYGVSGRRMRMHLMHDLAANADHAILVVKTPSGERVLDNRTNRVFPLSELSDVRPVLSFSEERRWTYAFAG